MIRLWPCETCRHPVPPGRTRFCSEKCDRDDRVLRAMPANVAMTEHLVATARAAADRLLGPPDEDGQRAPRRGVAPPAGAGACLGMDVHAFYVGEGSPGRDRGAPLWAQRLCAGCPLLAPCGGYAVVAGEHGVWGGLAREQRVPIRSELGLPRGGSPSVQRRAAGEHA